MWEEKIKDQEYGLINWEGETIVTALILVGNVQKIMQNLSNLHIFHFSIFYTQFYGGVKG